MGTNNPHTIEQMDLRVLSVDHLVYELMWSEGIFHESDVLKLIEELASRIGIRKLLQKVYINSLIETNIGIAFTERLTKFDVDHKEVIRLKRINILTHISTLILILAIGFFSIILTLVLLTGYIGSVSYAATKNYQSMKEKILKTVANNRMKQGL